MIRMPDRASPPGVAGGGEGGGGAEGRGGGTRCGARRAPGAGDGGLVCRTPVVRSRGRWCGLFSRRPQVAMFLVIYLALDACQGFRQTSPRFHLPCHRRRGSTCACFMCEFMKQGAPMSTCCGSVGSEHSPAPGPFLETGTYGRGTYPEALLPLPGGVFEMGDALGEGYETDGESPVHEVELSPFAVAATRVTNAMFARFV